MKTLWLCLALLISTAAAQETTDPASLQPPATVGTPADKAAPAKDPATVVARVGDEDITLGDFERQYRLNVAQLVGSQGVPFSEQVLPYFNQYRPEMLRQLVRQRGTLKLAQAAGIESDEAKVEEALASTKQGFESDQAFLQALQQAGYQDEAQLRQAIHDDLLSAAYLSSVQGRFEFNDAVVNAYYQGHKKDFTREAEACVKHILVKDEAAAKAAKARLDKGEDFAKVAGEVSQDPGSKTQGGDLGCFKRGVTVPEFDKAAFTGPLNQLQQVKTQFGVHLLIVSKRTEAGLAPLEEVRPDIVKALGQDAAERYVNSQLVRLGTEVHPEEVAAPQTEQDTQQDGQGGQDGQPQPSTQDDQNPGDQK